MRLRLFIVLSVCIWHIAADGDINSTDSSCEGCPICGVYDQMEVLNNKVIHNGKSSQITWINSLAFSSETSVFWIFNLDLNGFHPIRKYFTPEFWKSVNLRHSPKELPPLPPKELGLFKNNESNTRSPITETTINLEKGFKNTEMNITWINPLAFFKPSGSGESHSIWIYNATLPGYLEVDPTREKYLQYCKIQ